MFDSARGSGTEVIDEALAALVALRGDDLTSVPLAVLGDRLAGLAAIVEAASAELVRVTGRWDAEQGWALDGAGSAAGWFTHQSTCNRATDSRAPDTNDQANNRPPDGNGHNDNSHHDNRDPDIDDIDDIDDNDTDERHADDRDIDPTVDLRTRPERVMRSRPRPHVAPLPGLSRLDACHHTLGLGPAPVATIQRLLCNSHLNRVILGPDGRILDFGRRTRLFSSAQRIAVFIRDGNRCAYPGCTNHDHLDVHHLKPYEHGGHTTIDNGVALCESDHRRCHEGGHTLTRNPDGTYTATAPDPRRPRPPPHRR